MKPPPFLISVTAVINYTCPTPNTNIVIFGGKILDLFQSGGGRSEMNGLSSWSFAGMGGGGAYSKLGDMDSTRPGKPSLK